MVAGGTQREAPEDREAVGGSGNWEGEAGLGRDTAASLPRGVHREGSRVWAAEWRAEGPERRGRVAGPWTETRSRLAQRRGLPREAGGSPARSWQPARAGIRHPEAGRETRAGCWAARQQRVPR